jgi:hypothetical protein
MSVNPWLSIPLEEYESHMSEVRQSELLSELFREALDRCRPRSVAILGIAGGNGLEHIDATVTTRIVGIDINSPYLQQVRSRYAHLPGLELHEVDLSAGLPAIEPVELVHAALIFEHALCLPAAVSMTAPGGHLAVVLQERGASAIDWHDLGKTMRFIDPDAFRRDVPGTLVHERRHPVLNRWFWTGIFKLS